MANRSSMSSFKTATENSSWNANGPSPGPLVSHWLKRIARPQSAQTKTKSDSWKKDATPVRIKELGPLYGLASRRVKVIRDPQIILSLLDPQETPIKALSLAEYETVVKKIDRHLLPGLFLIFMFSIVNKLALSANTLFGLLRDLDISDQRYSVIISAYYGGYLAGQPIHSRLNQRFSVTLYSATCLIFTSLLTISSAAATNFASLLAIRFLMGVFQGSVVSSNIIIVSNWYRRQEQPSRMMIIQLSGPLANIILTFVSLRIDMLNVSVAIWRLIFLVFGALSLLTAIGVMFILPKSVKEAKFLNTSEKMSMFLSHDSSGRWSLPAQVNGTLQETMVKKPFDIGRSPERGLSSSPRGDTRQIRPEESMVSFKKAAPPKTKLQKAFAGYDMKFVFGTPGRQPWQNYQMWEGIKDPLTWALFVSGILQAATSTGQFAYFPRILQDLGFSSNFTLLVFNIPFSIVAAFAMFSMGSLATRVQDSRLILLAVSYALSFIGDLLLEQTRFSKGIYWWLIGIWFTGFGQAFYVLLPSFISSNVAGPTKVSTVGGIYLIGMSIGDIFGPFLFSVQQHPKYEVGIIVTMVFHAIMVILPIAVRYVLKHVNESRDGKMRQRGIQRRTIDSTQFSGLTDREMKVDFRYLL